MFALLTTFRTSETPVWSMSDSATPESDLQISAEVTRADAVETQVNLLVSPGSCPLEGRVFTFFTGACRGPGSLCPSE